MTVLESLREGILILDGGMGTLLQERGLRPGELPELWNLSHPDVITDIHRAYFDAGSNVVNTNTFGANPLKFDSETLTSVVHAAIDCARAARDFSGSAQKKYIALDIGPSGKMLAPLGDLDFEDAVRCFSEVIRIGATYGVDLIFIETMNDSYETKAALLAAKESCNLPVFVSNAYGADGKLMTGASPEAMVTMLESMGADAIGVNCSLGPRALAPVVDAYLAAASVPVLVKPNAGLPRVVEGKTVFDVLPAVFAEDTVQMLRAGVRAAGGCCGTTPDHIRALADAASVVSPVAVVKKNVTRVASYTHAVTFGEDPILIGERINPTGKKKFKEALRAHDMDYIYREGLSQAECGVHILDVNVGLPEIDEAEVLCEAVCGLQSILDLPLQIDTALPEAMERALRRVNGKPLVNSVNGKDESMDAVFPLVKKYGGTVIALTLDENGIPDDALGRVEIARRILARAEAYGIDRRDIIFDPLALTISTDEEAALQTLRAVRMIREELGCHTSLGVSNVSFGLPMRDLINASFFTLALGAGLSAAIMNPYSGPMMQVYHTYRALHGLDVSCAGYIAYTQTLSEVAPVTAAAAVPNAATALHGGSCLQEAIVRGLRDRASALTAEALADGTNSFDLVQEEIIPALNTVGAGFESKTVYLPQLLMSAEAAKASFEAIKAWVSRGGTATPGGTAATGGRYPIVLATVQGDIHDIGKNIVRLLLENYGFEVTDLGRDVAPQVICDAVLRLNAPLVGLSALMTTTVPAMEKTIRLLREQAPHCRVVVGGAVLTQEYADAIGADKYARDAMETVRYAETLCQ